MSTGLECEFHEVKPSQWFYILQDWNCPVGAWDWREHATAYGPFTSKDEAFEHLHRKHANPGGASIYPYDGDDIDLVVIELTKNASK